MKVTHPPSSSSPPSWPPPPLPAAPFHTFTSAKGDKSFEGHLLSSDGYRARIRTDKGSVVTLKLSSLSPEDREHAQKLGPILEEMQSVSLRIRHRALKPERDSQQDGDRTKTTRTKILSFVDIRNQLAKPIENATLECTVLVKHQVTGEKPTIVKKIVSKSLEKIEPRQTTQVTTDPVELENSRYRPERPKGGGGGGG